MNEATQRAIEAVKQLPISPLPRTASELEKWVLSTSRSMVEGVPQAERRLVVSAVVNRIARDLPWLVVGWMVWKAAPYLALLLALLLAWWYL